MEAACSNLKKRKICHEEDEEEAKIEKFCALVKSIRESRERLLKFGERENIVGIKEEKRVGVWKPEFEVEDFTEELERQKYPPLNLPSHKKGAAQESNKEAEKGVDLNLSLSL